MIKLPLVRSVSKYILKMMKVFGVYDEDVVPAVSEGDTLNREEIITPFLNVLTQFRDQVKDKATLGPKDLFKLCDDLRDDILPHLGIRLEDRPKGQEAIWKYEDKEKIFAEREAKLKENLKKEENARKRKEEELKKVSIIIIS